MVDKNLNTRTEGLCLPPTQHLHPPYLIRRSKKLLLHSFLSTHIHNAIHVTGTMASSSDDDDDVIPKMYSTIDEISRHLHHTGSIISAANCDANSSTTLHEKTKNKTHLFLHFDVNETILLGDPAGGDSVHECVNKIIAKSAFVSTSGIDDHQDDPTQPRIKRSPSSGNICDTHQFEPTHWWNGMSINDCDSAPPPLYTGWVIPPNTCPFYRTRYKVHAKKFTSTLHGQVYRPLYEKLCLKMGLDCAHADDGIGGESDVQQHQPTSVFKNFLPAFWQTLQYYFPSTKTELSNESAQSAVVVSVGTDCRRLSPPQKVTLVLRTFGLDLPRVATAISEFAKGNHPDYPTYSNEDLILAEDNYPFWRENNHAPWAGKPVWTNTIVHGHDHHHVLLDDNIHNDPSDGAGGIRVPVVSENDEDGGSSNNYNRYESLHGQEALDLH
eukprot:scaffold5513_cov141-Skeletonema_menzelii.AAC.6